MQSTASHQGARKENVFFLKDLSLQYFKHEIGIDR